MIAVNGDGIMSRYAFCRSVSDSSTYRVDLPGSDKNIRFLYLVQIRISCMFSSL